MTRANQGNGHHMDDAVTNGLDQRNYVSSLLKACRLLGYFSHDQPELTLAALAEHSGLNKTTVHRLLTTLVMAGWLTRGDGNTYRLTMRVFQIGSIALAGTNLPTEAKPFLRRLADQFGDTAYLMVPSGLSAVCIDSVTGDSPVRVNSVEIGTSLPLHVAAGPITMLAYRPDLLAAVLEAPLTPFTAQTATSRTDLEKRLDVIRDQGYGESDRDYLDQVAAIAAPVFDSTGQLIATLSLGGTADSILGERRQAIIEAVTDCAGELTDRLDGSR